MGASSAYCTAFSRFVSIAFSFSAISVKSSTRSARLEGFFVAMFLLFERHRMASSSARHLTEDVVQVLG